MTYARQISVFILFALANGLVVAADIYRWVDESGRTHVSDVVPQAYKGKAERIDTGPSQISPEDRQAAQRRVEQERRLLEQREREAASMSERPSPAAVPKAGAMSPPLQSLENPACAEKWRAYRESQECFAPFMRGARTRHGHRRPAHLSEEAYRYCTPVADPSAECPIPAERR
ncbi:DUF4124 domain-containing protein [uncultured Oxalicibacterium sp.]|uniref:DUF4124 domain-containing protein n=1 Tax=uncultured Oxalicibacterium sp. TaxID=1168540 RepID=UPI0025E6CD85|nr:DUF4124 domain-containing protein [uncultured Oxalicibacterium sp.]